MERAKTFLHLAALADCERFLEIGNKGARRGLIAKRALKILQDYKFQEFAESCKRITFDGRPIKENGRIVGYL